MKIFLSHSSKDKPLVREIRKQLPEHIKAWIDEKELLIGEDLEGSIKNAIDAGSDFVLLFLSSDSVESEWVNRELEWALKREKEIGRPFVLPILLDKQSWDLVQPSSFRSRKYILCSDFSENGVAQVAKEVSDELFAWLSRNLEESAERKAHIKIVDIPVQKQSEQILNIGKGELLECSAIEPKLRFPYKTDFIGQDVFFPMIDLKFKNSGDDVSYLTSLEIDVQEVRVNPVPILEFYISTTKQHDLLIQVKNCGWGPALDVYIDNLNYEEFRKHLKLQQKDYFWHGTIEAEKIVDIVIPRSSILIPSNNPISCPCGFVTYRDVDGEEYGFMFRYTPYPFEDYTININKNSFEVTYQDYARAKEPSARYNIILPTEPSSYRQSFQISHEVAPKETERFQIVIASEKSADFRFIVQIRYDGDNTVRSDEVNLSVVNPNHLWYYNYLKPSWLSQATESLRGHHSANEVFVQKLFSKGGDEFSEVYLHGEQIIESIYKPKSSDTDIKDRESSANAFNNIAWMLIDEEVDIAEGIRKAKKALELSPNDPYILDTLALGHYKKESYREAIRYWEMAQQHGLDDDELRECLDRARKAEKMKQQ